MDSGGQYEFGTTDVTRTISLKNSNKELKIFLLEFLKVILLLQILNLKKTHLDLNIDIGARKYLKQIGLDYAHGTGHGVGYFLNVHEGPHAISKRKKLILKKV